jgi:hypothetical protein
MIAQEKQREQLGGGAIAEGTMEAKRARGNNPYGKLKLAKLHSRQPRLLRYNIYVTIFYKVMQTFFFFLMWYSFFIEAFGLGFYIMLQTDVNAVGTGAINPNLTYYYFDLPWLALVQTSVMFVGELEFRNIPIYVTRTDGTPVIAYIFLGRNSTN